MRFVFSPNRSSESKQLLSSSNPMSSIYQVNNVATMCPTLAFTYPLVQTSSYDVDRARVRPFRILGFCSGRSSPMGRKKTCGESILQSGLWKCEFHSKSYFAINGRNVYLKGP